MKGLIQIPLLILLLLGTGAGVYLVQQKTHFLPQAFSSQNILNILSNKTASNSSTQVFTYQPQTPTPAVNNSGGFFLSAFQRLLQRKAVVSTSSPKPTPTSALHTPTPTSTTNKTISNSKSTPTPIPAPTQTGQNSTSNPKPVCSVVIAPAGTGYTPYQASVCVGNNSNPYQAVQQEFADYDGNGTWDYQGPSYGCHAFTFQNPGTYYPKAKIIGISGTESDVCQTTVIISAVNPTPTPTPTPANPTPTPGTSTCSQGSLGMYIKFQDITASGPTLKYVNLSLRQPGTNNELWKYNSLPATNNISAFFNYTNGDIYRIALSGVACGTYDIYVSSSGYQEKKFPNIIVDNNPWNDPEAYIFNGPLPLQ